MIEVTSGSSVAAINAALVAAANAGGGMVQLEAGDYQIGAAEQIAWPASGTGVSLLGQGIYGTRFHLDGGRSGDAVNLTAGNLSHVSLRDMGFYASAQITSGAVIHTANCHNLIMERIMVTGPYNDGIKLDGGAGQYLATLRDVSTEATGSYRSLCLGTDRVPLLQGVYLFGCKFFGSRYGIWCENVSGLTIIGGEVLQHTADGFVTYPQAGEVCEFFQLTAFSADSCGDTGIYLGSGGGIVQGVTVNNSWSGSNKNVGMQIVGAPQGNGIAITGGTRMEGNINGSIVNYGASNYYLSPSCYLDKP